MIIYQLPLPPSVNAMFANLLNGRGKRPGRVKTSEYRDWCRRAGIHMLLQGPLRKITGPVAIRIIVSENARGDLDNRTKSVLDLLVHHQIIEDDSKRIVRKLLLEWGDVEGAQVEITEQPDWTEHRNLARRPTAAEAG